MEILKPMIYKNKAKKYDSYRIHKGIITFDKENCSYKEYILNVVTKTKDLNKCST